MFKKLNIDLGFIIKKGLDISPDCFGILDQQDLVVYCNDTFASVFGLIKEQVIGRSNQELLRLAWEAKQGIVIDTDDFESWYAVLEELRKEKALNQFETNLWDGRWFQMTRMNLDGDYILLFGAEITELKQTQASLEKANLQIEQLANTDQLTGANNRRSFNLIAEKERYHALCHQYSLSLLLLDIDYFKEINDNYGHDSGDFILSEFSRICTSVLRQSDSFSRIGGEEFAILLPLTDSAGALLIAERIRAEVAAHQFHLEHLQCDAKISVSIGVSSLLEKEQSIKDLLVQADMALYTAKRNGRNRVIEYR